MLLALWFSPLRQMVKDFAHTYVATKAIHDVVLVPEILSNATTDAASTACNFVSDPLSYRHKLRELHDEVDHVGFYSHIIKFSALFLVESSTCCSHWSWIKTS